MSAKKHKHFPLQGELTNRQNHQVQLLMDQRDLFLQQQWQAYLAFTSCCIKADQTSTFMLESWSIVFTLSQNKNLVSVRTLVESRYNTEDYNKPIQDRAPISCIQQKGPEKHSRKRLDNRNHISIALWPNVSSCDNHRPNFTIMNSVYQSFW